MENEEKLTLADPVEQGDNSKISLSPDSQITPEGTTLTGPVVQSRTQKIMFGLGDTLNKNESDVYQNVASGKEEILRREAASAIDYKNAMRRQEKIVELANKKGSPLDLNEVARVLDPFSPVNKPADPNDVIEKAYAHQFITSADTAAQYMDSILTDANQEIPNQVEPVKDKAFNFISKIEYARTLGQNIEEEVNNQGWVPWMADQAKMLFQPYVEYKMRGNTEDVGTVTGGILLGDNLKAQADHLLSLPYDQYKDQLTNTINYLRKDNPSLAQQFISYVVGASESERKLSNVFTMLAPADYAAAGRGALSLTRKIDMFNRVQKGFKDVVKATKTAEEGTPLRSAIAEGAGNVEEAGITKAADDLTKKMDGKLEAEKEIKDSLLSFFDQDARNVAAKPGNLSVEQRNRLVDGFYSSANSLWDTILNMARVNRTPLPLANEDAVRAYKEASRREFPELSNNLLDISNPRPEPVSGTYKVDFTFGNSNGRLFSNEQTAKNYAEAKGFLNVKVVPAEGAVEAEGPKLIGSASDLRRKPQLERSIPEAEKTLKRRQSELRNKSTTPERKVELAEEIKFFKDTIKRYKEDLTKINSRVTEAPARIEQQGFGFKFVITKPYRETDDIVRNFLIKDVNGKYSDTAASPGTSTGFSSWKNSALGWIRSADDTLSYNENLQRKVATYTQSLLRKWADGDIKSIEAVSTGTVRKDPVTGAPVNIFKAKAKAFIGKFSGDRQMFREFNEVLDYARKAHDPVTKEKGYFFKDTKELEDHYQRFYQRLPTYPEVEAYFAHVKLVEANRILTEIAEYRNRARLGVEQHRLYVIGGNSKRMDSDFFDGVRHKEWPGGDDTILIMGDRPGEEVMHNLGSSTLLKSLDKYKEDVLTGKRKVIEIYDVYSNPLKKFSTIAGDEPIRYVLTSNVETKPMDFNHVTRRGGGHFDYDYDHYIKQAKIIPQQGGAVGNDKRKAFRNIYAGDTTVMPIDNRIMGKNVVKHLEHIRQLIKARDFDAAKAYTKANLHIEWDEVYGWFKHKRGPDGVLNPPHLSLDEPFYVVPKGKKIYDLDKSLELRYEGTFKDGTKSGSLANQYQVAYNVERDANGLKTLRDVGKQGMPLYQWENAKLVDPIPTMNRSLSRAVNSTFMDDYKMYAVEHWIREAVPYLKATENEVRSSPFWHFNNPDFKAGVEKNIQWNLMANRYKINQFIGMPSATDTWIHGQTQKILDSFYERFGPEETRSGLQRITIIPAHLLSRAKDPIQILRSVAFNAKLGLFTIPQLLVQAQSHATIWALSPKHGTVGTYAMLLHTWSSVNKSPEYLRLLDNYATKLNGFGSKWRPGEWLEAMKELDNTGFHHVSGEYVARDSSLTDTFIKGDAQKFLEAGQYFFKKGEQATRVTAWYTAFREFREAHPTGALTQADRAAILNRADTLTTNMSRASASALHGGVFSLSTQFLAYQLRMAELFWGKRLGATVSERMYNRAKLLTFYSALYGAPSALGITGYPFGDAIRRYATDNGYVVGDNYLSSMINEGLPAIMLAVISGGGDMRKGNFYNVGNRFGVQGFSQIREAMKADASWWKLFGGAGGNILTNTIASLDPFWNKAKSLMAVTEDGNEFPLSTSDFLDVFNEVSTVSSTRRLVEAIHTGRWLSKNESYISDTSKLNAFFMTMTGLDFQGKDDIFMRADIHQAEIDLQKDTMKKVIKDYHRYLDAVRDGDEALAVSMGKRVRARLISSGYPESKMAQLFAIASKDYEKQIDTSKFNFGTKDVPSNKVQKRIEQLTRQLQLDEYRNKP